MKWSKSLKERWNAYLRRLGAANSRTYGNQRLDCCTLNHPSEEENSPGSTNVHSTTEASKSP